MIRCHVSDVRCRLSVGTWSYSTVNTHNSQHSCCCLLLSLVVLAVARDFHRCQDSWVWTGVLHAKASCVSGLSEYRASSSWQIFIVRVQFFFLMCVCVCDKEQVFRKRYHECAWVEHIHKIKKPKLQAHAYSCRETHVARWNGTTLEVREALRPCANVALSEHKISTLNAFAKIEAQNFFF